MENATPEHPFVVEVKVHGESGYTGNGLSFETAEDAQSYGMDLLWRWLGAETFRVIDARTGAWVTI